SLAHPFADHIGRFAACFTHELVVRHARHVDKQIDAVQERSRKAPLIARHRAGRASAVASRVTQEPARASVKVKATCLRGGHWCWRERRAEPEAALARARGDA